MIHNDKVLGRPLAQYTATRANIEALTGLVEGTIAYASDDEVLLYYDGSEWLVLGGEASNLIIETSADNEKITQLQLFEDTLETSPLVALQTYDTNLSEVFGTQPLTNPSTKRLMVESANAPETTVHGVMAKLNDEVRINTSGAGTVVIQLGGVWVGAVQFQFTIDGNTWTAIQAANIAGTYRASSSSSNAFFRIPVAGFSAIRLAMTTYTSGSCRAMLVSSPISVSDPQVQVSGNQNSLITQRTSTELTTSDSALFSAMGAFTEPAPWNPNVYQYFVGDTITYNGLVYFCITSHAPTSFFPTNTTYWRVDPRQSKSLVSTSNITKPSAARLNVQSEYDTYLRQLAEEQYLATAMQLQQNATYMDYQLSISQEAGNKQYAMTGSYIIEEIR